MSTDNPTNWKPVFGKDGKPTGFVSWDTPEKRIERSINELTDILNNLKLNNYGT